jgi:murein DD-endopeptidase MepM/ murein hydrolase activator NlpD
MQGVLPNTSRGRLPSGAPRLSAAHRMAGTLRGYRTQRLRRAAPRREWRRLTLWLQGGDGTPRRLDIPLAALALAVMLLAAAIFGSIEYGMRSQATAQALRAQTQRLSAQALAGAAAEDQLQHLQQQAATLQTTLSTIAQLDGKVRAAAGAPSPQATAGLSSSNPTVSHLDAASGVLRQLQQAIPALTQDVQSLDQAMTDWTTQAAHTPSIWPVDGPITSPFGARLSPFDGNPEIHTGVDIGVPAGTPVHATAAGTVVFAGWNNIYGNQVIVATGDGLDTMFGHNERLLVHAGEQVGKGQVLALSGSTGWSTGPHVHYEIDQNGQPINPDHYLPGYADVASGGGASHVGTGSAGNFGYGGR